MIEFDDSPISLTADQDAVLRRTVRLIQQNLGSLIIKQGDELIRGVAQASLRITESNISELGKLLGACTEAEQEINRRHGELRAANIRIHELEAMMGQALDPAVIQMGLKSLDEQLNGWWNLEGFGLVREISFGSYNCKVNFSCSLFGDFHLTDSPTPLTDKEQKALWRQSLVDRGFVLFEYSGDMHLMDCEKTRATLYALFQNRLPGSRISRFISHENKAGSSLDAIEVSINKIEQIKNLPVAPTRGE